MEGTIGERRAIGSHKQIAALEIRGIHRRELYLHRPVRQARRHVHHRRNATRRRRERVFRRRRIRSAVHDMGRSSLAAFRHHTRLGFAHNHFRHGARTAARGHACMNLGLCTTHFLGNHGCLIVGRSLALDEFDGIFGARRQAIAQPIAIIVAQKARLAVHQANRALVACMHAQTAACAPLFVNMDNTSFHATPFVIFASA